MCDSTQLWLLPSGKSLSSNIAVPQYATRWHYCRFLSLKIAAAPLIKKSLGLSGGFMPCRHLRPSSRREHTIVELIQSGDDDYLMNESRRKPTTGRQSPSLFNKWHRIFYMPSRVDEAGHTKAFDYPVAAHWGESRNVQFRGWDSNRQHIGLELNPLPTEPPRFPLIKKRALTIEGCTNATESFGQTNRLHCLSYSIPISYLIGSNEEVPATSVGVTF